MNKFTWKPEDLQIKKKKNETLKLPNNKTPPPRLTKKEVAT